MGLILASDYSGTNYSTTFTASSRAALADAIKNAMTSAGWTATGSSGNWEVTNPSHPNGYSVTIRIWDPGSGNYTHIGVKSPVDLTGTQIPQLDYTVGGTWLIACSGWQVVCINLGAFDTVGGTKLFISLPYGPASWASIGGTSVVAVVGSGRRGNIDDLNMFRSLLGAGVLAATGHSIMQPGWTFGGGGAAYFRYLNDPSNINWAKGVVHCEPPLLTLSDNSGVQRVVGFVWDCFVAYNSGASIGDTWTYDSMTFRCFARAGSTLHIFFRTA
jgi:hypothetical protein